MKKKFYTNACRFNCANTLKHIGKAVLLIFIFCGLSCNQKTETSKLTQEAISDSVRAEQIAELKFGMFICWSTSSFSGKEWTRDGHGPEFFEATGCNTDQWCRVAKESEMKYILFLAKHHDGLCLWDTKTTEKKVTNSPLGIDVLARLKESCDKYGLKLSLYFSEGDWSWENGKNKELKKEQLKELLTNYGNFEHVWFDAAAGDGGLTHEETVEWVHSFQPNVFTGFNHGPIAGRLRVGESRLMGPLESRSKKHVHNALFKGIENNNWKLAEMTYTIFNGRSPAFSGFGNWFYTKEADKGICVSPEYIYRDYLECIKYKGILDLCVAPMRNGNLRPVDIGTLYQVGRYIRQEDVFEDNKAWGVTHTASSSAKGRDFWHRNFSADNAFDELDQTYWQADSTDTSPSLTVEFDNIQEISYVRINQPEGANYIKKYKIESKSNGIWETILEGEQIISGFRMDFPVPIHTKSIRLKIESFEQVPCVAELKFM
uniref:alpha-L-fucosidase n=1 Tax=uncultured Draconibacterium sp. TaxID=1573823 RepID=UPI003216FB75